MESAKEILSKMPVVDQIATPQTKPDSEGSSPDSSKPKLVKPSEYYHAACQFCLEVFDNKAEADKHMAWERGPDRASERAIRGMLDNGILKEHMDAKLADFPKDAQRAVGVLLGASQNHGLLATGEPGTGKTRLMVAICRESLLAGKKVEYTMARAFFRKLWATYRDDARESEQQVLGRLCSVPLLAIDDLGHEGKVSEAVVGALHEVLSQRHGNYLPTVITTNLSIEEIGRHYDTSIASRLQAWLAVCLRGGDRRLG